VCWKRTGAGVAGRRLANSIASVLWILTRSFHLVKYRSKTDVAWVSRLTVVSVRQDCGVIDCNEWKTVKRHDFSNMGKVKLPEL
jgi:hypothetical protein